MRRLPRLLSYCALGCAMCLGAVADAGGPLSSVPHVKTTQTRFRVPFDFNVDQLKAARAGAIELHVSRDGGEWLLAGTAELDQTFLLYDAPGPGDYRFCVRARSIDGRLLSDTPMAPSLVVTIDGASGSGPKIQPAEAAAPESVVSNARTTQSRANVPVRTASLSSSAVIGNGAADKPADAGEASVPVPVPAPAPRSDIEETIQRVRSNAFQIGYALEEVGSSGVGSVDLFITEDGGRNWFHYGDDPDAVSPVDVTVPRDGEYGFAFRIRSGVGLGDIPPQPGERPEVTIIVDRTPPTASMLVPLQGAGDRRHQITIRWTAQDASLTSRPISLASAPTATGPWTTIESELPNTGSYLWTMSEPVPPQIFLRMTATDAAGNESSSQTTEPLTLDLSRPAARILKVMPVSR